MSDLDEVFDAVAAYFSIMAAPTRLKIMHTIGQQERSVTEIVDEVGATQTNVSRHLGLMHQSRVVTRRKEGTQVFYRIADPTMIDICRGACVRIARTMDERKPLRKKLIKLAPVAFSRKSKS